MSEACRLTVVSDEDQSRTECDLDAIMLLRPEDVGYIAGFFDGEGTFDIAVQKGHKRQSYGIAMRVHISQSDPTPLLWIKRLFGGTLTHVRAKNYWMWCISNEMSVSAFTRVVQPYLRVKRREADIMIEYLVRRGGLSMDEKKAYSHRLRVARFKAVIR